MGYMVNTHKCGCKVVVPGGRWAKITVARPNSCQGECSAVKQAKKFAEARDKRNAQAVEKAKITRAKNAKKG